MFCSEGLRKSQVGEAVLGESLKLNRRFGDSWGKRFLRQKS